MKQSLNLAAIGNCSVAALIAENSNIEWFCYPQFDADPVLPSLINGNSISKSNGCFSIQLVNLHEIHQKYIERTAVLVTTQKSSAGDEIEIIDFCPISSLSYKNPLDLKKNIIRIVRVIKGNPEVIVKLDPFIEYGRYKAKGEIKGDQVICYSANNKAVFLQTNAPIDSVLFGTTIQVTGSLFFSFGDYLNGLSLLVCEQYLSESQKFWIGWINKLKLPKLYNDEVIRAAIALKLCTHAPTGGMVAALTSSIPEYDNCNYRHWDYRYSWVRDNFFTINALTALGDVGALASYAVWLQKILKYCRDNNVYPAAFRIAGTHDAEEEIVTTLSGYRGQGMVRVGNEAYKQQQNDFFSSVISSLLPFFLDDRFKAQDCPIPVEWLEGLAEIAYSKYDRADAGLWELRTQERIYTYSAINCWNACYSISLIFSALSNSTKAEEWQEKADTMKNDIIARGWNQNLQSFTNAFQSDDADASLFLIGELAFLSPEDLRFEQTIQFLEKRLRKDIFVFRYDHADDFGPGCVNAFVPCTLWMIHAFADIKEKRKESKEVFEKLLKLRSKQGMLSEHIDTKTGELWANYPQTFSMAGIITAAIKLSG